MFFWRNPATWGEGGGGLAARAVLEGRHRDGRHRPATTPIRLPRSVWTAGYILMSVSRSNTDEEKGTVGNSSQCRSSCDVEEFSDGPPDPCPPQAFPRLTLPQDAHWPSWPSWPGFGLPRVEARCGEWMFCLGVGDLRCRFPGGEISSKERSSLENDSLQQVLSIYPVLAAIPRLNSTTCSNNGRKLLPSLGTVWSGLRSDGRDSGLLVVYTQYTSR